ncbi:MAG: zinc ABC transporter substrate-binding protein [Clostridiales bacterium]|nr:zinc ABC transporter substrate-binding protein [Clostridiales bacterium]
MRKIKQLLVRRKTVSGRLFVNVKKLLSVVVAAFLAVGSLTACSSAGAKGKDKIKIVTTIFPEYDWVMNVLGDKASNADVTLLLDNGVDLHSFQPTASDIMKVSSCDLFVYVGGESDDWVADALKEATNKDMVVINLLDVLGDKVKEEEVVEGMQGEDEDEEEDEGEIEYDEHVWLSLRNAEVLVQSISDAMQKIDASNAEAYKKNSDAYIESLKSLDSDYKAVVEAASNKTLLFGDRFPFRYLVDDYGLTYYAAFVGCSAESEASFETITFLSKKVDELNLPVVLTIEGKDHRIAETIVQNTTSKDQKILTMDSMQSASTADHKNGTTYLSIMKANLSVLTEALK